MRQLSALCFFALIGVSLCWSLRESTTCQHNGEPVEDGETVGEGCNACVCLGGHMACYKKRSCVEENSRPMDRRATCTYRGNEMQPGEQVDEGDHFCRCTESGYMLCSRSAKRSSTDGSCALPDGGTLAVGEREIYDEGTPTCARCSCTVYEGTPFLGCVSCSPPVQEAPKYAGHIEK